MNNPVAMLRSCKDGDDVHMLLWFVCPGCKAQGDGFTGLHALPVNGQSGKRPNWRFDGNLEAPTLEPSILSRGGAVEGFVCHSFLRGGVFEFLSDCTHPLKDQKVPIGPLPDWFCREEQVEVDPKSDS